MIVDHIENLEQTLKNLNLPENIIRGLKYLKETDLKTLPLGKHIIDGDKIFVNLNNYDTKLKEDAKPEAHVKYIDIQYMIKGEEAIYYTRLTPGLIITEDKLAEKDVIFYGDLQNESELVMKPGMYTIFFPWDVHRPNCTYQNKANVLKAIVKIKI